MVGGRVVKASRPPPPALVSVSAHGVHSAVGAADGTLSLYDLTATARGASRVPLGVGAAAVALRAGKGAEKRAAVAAFADKHGRVFAGGGGGPAKKKARKEALPGDGKSGKPVLVKEMAGGRIVLAAGEEVVAAVGGGKKELVVFGLDGGDVKTWELGKFHATSLGAALVLPGDKGVVVCGQAVTVVDVNSGVVTKRYQGHGTPVTSVAIMESGKKFITGCAGDQFMSVWTAPTESSATNVKKRRKSVEQSAALHTFVAPEAGVRHIAVDSAREEGSTKESDGGSIAAQMPSGCVAVWTNVDEAMASNRATSSPDFVVRPADEDLVLFCSFVKPGYLTIAHGHPLRPAFFEVAVNDIDSEFVDIPAANTVGLLASKAEDPSKPTGRETVAKSERNVAVALRDAASLPQVDAKEGATTSKRPNGLASKLGGQKLDSEMKEAGSDVGNGAADESGVNDERTRRKRENGNGIANGENDVDGEETMAEKLASMGVGPHGSSGSRGVVSSRSTPGKPRPIDSIGNVLTQAIQAKDDKLFDSVIGQTTDTKVISQTVSRMSFTVATGDFLHMLVTRLAQRPGRTLALLPWIKAVLMEHASALAVQGRSPVLDKLLSTITARVETLPVLSRLEGRLELVVAQADRVRATRKTAGTSTVPAVEYIEEARHVGLESEEDLDSEDDGSVLSGEGGSGGEDEEDADETGDFSEESDESSSSSWEDEEEEEEEGTADGASHGRNNMKAKSGVEDLMDMSASESDS